MKYKIFIDGKVGTTSLELETLLKNREEIEIINISEEKRKNINGKLKLMEKADLTFLCLPDEAAKEMVSLAPERTRIIDTSTAHRTKSDWIYGLPEIGKREEIKKATRVANPGCHATAFILGIKPLIEHDIMHKDDMISAVSITGYSGGGKSMIADYEKEGRILELDSPGQYGTGQKHKHLPEMKKYGGIDNSPCFLPIVSDFYRGMATSVPVNGRADTESIRNIFKEYYKNEKLITVSEEEKSTIYANELANTNRVKIYVCGSENRVVVTTLIDNLGKGAAGAAVQNMNIMLGIDELKGLL